jgi:hypothetical protein
MPRNNSYTFDAATLLKDAGAVTSSAAGTVGGAAAVWNAGSAFVEGVLNVDITEAPDIDANNEAYTIVVQGATAAAFTTPVQLAALSLGAAETVLGAGIDTAVGRYQVRFQNEQNGVIYPYIRVYTVVAGTVVAGLNFIAWVGKTGSDS